MPMTFYNVHSVEQSLTLHRRKKWTGLDKKIQSCYPMIHFDNLKLHLYQLAQKNLKMRSQIWYLSAYRFNQPTLYWKKWEPRKHFSRLKPQKTPSRTCSMRVLLFVRNGGQHGRLNGQNVTCLNNRFVPNAMVTGASPQSYSVLVLYNNIIMLQWFQLISLLPCLIYYLLCAVLNHLF